MAIDLANYNTIIFDCDGVILDSNAIKTQAFYELGMQYSQDVAEQLRCYHQEHGGISRFHKMLYLHETLLQNDQAQEGADKDIAKYGDIVKRQLLTCPITEGFMDVIKAIQSRGTCCLVVSGSYQPELREVFEERNLNVYFEGVFGSPDNKIEIIGREIQSGLVKLPAIVIGDSKADYLAAAEFNLDFLFMKRHTEFDAWESYFKAKDIAMMHDFRELVSDKEADATTL